MRRVFTLILVLILPLASGLIANTELPEHERSLSHEVIVTSYGNQWTQSMWNDLEQFDITPLRLLSETELLAWRGGPLLDNMESYEFSNGHETKWRGNIEDYDGFVGEIRIVFEPNLPESASQHLIAAFAKLGFKLSDHLRHYSSVIPHRELITISHESQLVPLFDIEGVLWIEPVLSTVGRNLQAASLMATGEYLQVPHWSFGLNGSGVVLGIADSGIDYDHACFRNATSTGDLGSNADGAVGTIGENHRKILAINTSIDSSDTMGHINFRHGTHTAGSLSCFDVYDYRDGSIPSNGSSMAHGASIVVQDIVSAEGWVPPENVSELLAEAAMYGSIIHSNSWGDDTTAYTARSGEFDAWSKQMPWSLAFIAPGNTGGAMLEPANARNVAAIGVSTKSVSPEKWSSSSIGPTPSGTFGIFALAPGVSIQSAKADGISDSYNNDLRSSSGTSMSTPTAASFAGVVQQMVQDGWFVGSNERLTNENLTSMSPAWANLSNDSILLGEGFYPSGPLLKALLSIATTNIGSPENYTFRNPESGFGVLDLSGLIDFNLLNASLGSGNISPTPNIWIHDSYRLSNKTPTQWLEERTDGGNVLHDIIDLPWDGTGAVGPFLSTGQNWTKRLVPNGEDITFSMSFNAAPEPYLVDDLQLIARLSNGFSAVGGIYDGDGFSSWFNQNEDLDNESLFPKSNETTAQIKISASDLQGIEWIDVEIRARYVSPGTNSGYVGIGGNKVGFALVSKGVIRDSTNWEDSDGDGLANVEDSCPNENPSGWDNDGDGCTDDSDSDGVKDPIDICVHQNSSGFDNNQDGCIDDSDGDGVGDNLDLCLTAEPSTLYPVNLDGCRPLDSPPEIDIISINGLDNGVWDSTLKISWEVSDKDADPFKTGAKLLLHQNTNQSSYFSIKDCNYNAVEINEVSEFECVWVVPNDLPLFDISGKEMHIQIYVQSLNQSPEAYISTIYLDDDRNFSSSWTNPIFQVEDGKAVKNEPWNVGQRRAIFWGVAGLLGMGILLSRIWKNNMMDKGQFGTINDENRNKHKKYRLMDENE